MRNQVQITEEQLREYYAQSTNRYLQDESRQARHILIPFGEDRGAAEEQAGALVERARAGEPFEDLARQYSADSSTAEQGGTLDTTLKSQMPEALGNAIFSMDRGEIAGPVESEFGFHVVRLDSIQAGGPLPLEQVRAELENELRDIEADEAFQDLQRSLESIETSLEQARRYYNAVVRDLNTKIQSVPSVFVARLFGFAEREFFELDNPTEAEVPAVRF